MTPTEQLRDPALEHLRFAARLADEASTSKLRTRLAAAASEASGFAGWLALDLGDHGAARRHYDEAIKRAHQAQRPLLAAYMVGSMSLWAAELGNGNEAVALSEQAYGLLPLSGQAPPAAEVWMALVEATARRVVKMPRRRTTRSAGPLPALHQAVAVGSPASKQHGLLACDMATSYLLADEVEEACRLAAAALAVGRDRRSPRVIHRVRDFRAQLDPSRHGRCVRQLDEQLLNVVLNP